jgi:hypothetical protein
MFQEREWNTLVGSLSRFGIPYSIHKVIPFIGELVPPLEVSGKVVCFGSYSMRHAAKAAGWTPGVYDLFEMDFRQQLERWGSLMLNADSKVSAFHAADITEVTFMRPIDDSKYFAGKVFEVDEFYDWKRKVCVLEHDYGNSMTKDTLIQLCPPKLIYSEYRYWVVDGRIVTKSLYKRGSRVIYSDEVPEELDKFVEDAIDLWQPHRAFVIDICDTPDGLKIVEINTINSAGFYAGNVQKLIVALEIMEA